MGPVRPCRSSVHRVAPRTDRDGRAEPVWKPRTARVRRRSRHPVRPRREFRRQRRPSGRPVGEHAGRLRRRLHLLVDSERVHQPAIRTGVLRVAAERGAGGNAHHPPCRHRDSDGSTHPADGRGRRRHVPERPPGEPRRLRARFARAHRRRRRDAVRDATRAAPGQHEGLVGTAERDAVADDTSGEFARRPPGVVTRSPAERGTRHRRTTLGGWQTRHRLAHAADVRRHLVDDDRRERQLGVQRRRRPRLHPRRSHRADEAVHALRRQQRRPERPRRRVERRLGHLPRKRHRPRDGRRRVLPGLRRVGGHRLRGRARRPRRDDDAQRDGGQRRQLRGGNFRRRRLLGLRRRRHPLDKERLRLEPGTRLRGRRRTGDPHPALSTRGQPQPPCRRRGGRRAAVAGSTRGHRADRRTPDVPERGCARSREGTGVRRLRRVGVERRPRPPRHAPVHPDARRADQLPTGHLRPRLLRRHRRQGPDDTRQATRDVPLVQRGSPDGRRPNRSVRRRGLRRRRVRAGRLWRPRRWNHHRRQLAERLRDELCPTRPQPRPVASVGLVHGA